jgi:ABC-type branched-subunit amino acid transport system ATPase component
VPAWILLLQPWRDKTLRRISIALTSVFGWTVERVGYRPLRGSNRLAPRISSIWISIFLQNMVQLTQGARVKSISPLVTGGVNLFGGDGFHGPYVSYAQILIVAATILLLIALTCFINKTAFGRQQRACEQDQRMMQFLGYNVDRIIALTFMIGAALAAVAGVMVTLYYGVIDFSIGFEAGIKAFTAAVLGGNGSIFGAMLGGVIIGLIEAFCFAYLSPENLRSANSILQLVPEGRRIFQRMTVLENLLMGDTSDNRRTNDDFERMYEMFPILRGRASQRAGTLSGGEQQMLAICRALKSQPRLLLLDEPLLGLAPIFIKKIFSVIKELSEQFGMTILLVEQNAHHALRIANRGYVLQRGQIALEGSGGELLANPAVRAAYLEGDTAQLDVA